MEKIPYEFVIGYLIEYNRFLKGLFINFEGRKAMPTPQSMLIDELLVVLSVAVDKLEQIENSVFAKFACEIVKIILNHYQDHQKAA